MLTDRQIEALKELALRSGRPLEVQVASAFMQKDWRIRLSSYYTDTVSQKPRELDVLAQKTSSFEAKDKKYRLLVNAFISCKGFSKEHQPVTWSVPEDFAHDRGGLMCSRGGLLQNDMDTFKASISLYLAKRIGDGRRLLSLKSCILKDSSADFVRDRDSDLYEGADSAIKAACTWHERGPTDMSIQVPIVVVDKDVVNVPIDNLGTPGEAKVIRGGFFEGLFPFGGLGNGPAELMILLWSWKHKDELLAILDELIEQSGAELSTLAMKWD